MKPFVDLYDTLDATTRTNEKIAAIAEYVGRVPAEDAAWAVWFLAGGRIRRGVSGPALRAWVSEVTGHPPWLVSECHAAAGDLAEAITLLVPPSAGLEDRPLHRIVAETVLPLPHLDDAERRATVVSVWEGLPEHTRFVWLKLAMGAFRVGVQRSLVARALAEHAGLDRAVIAHRLTGATRRGATATPTAAWFDALVAPVSGRGSAGGATRGADGAAGGVGGGPDDRLPGASDDVTPFPFFLASPLERDPATLGPSSEWAFEWKWDGIRAQLVRRGDAVLVWSRGEEPVGGAFPEVVALGRRLPAGTVLDGEIVAWESDRPLPFGDLQRRLNRVDVAPMLFPDVPVRFLAFDVLEASGMDVRDDPLDARRARLVDAIEPLASDGEAVTVTPWLDVRDWSHAAQLQATGRAVGTEGLMVKRRASPYRGGRVRGDWWKWKVDPFTIDAVIVAAQPGHGRRAGLLTDYTFAVRDDRGGGSAGAGDGDGRGRGSGGGRGDDNGNGNRNGSGDAEQPDLVTVAKAYSGLTNDEIVALDRRLRRLTVDRRGTWRSIRPEVVAELAFEGIQSSSRHASGIAVRFPRIVRLRPDKSPSEVDTLRDLRALLQQQETRARTGPSPLRPTLP